jgi:hypothetical protein
MSGPGDLTAHAPFDYDYWRLKKPEGEEDAVCKQSASQTGTRESRSRVAVGAGLLETYRRPADQESARAEIEDAVSVPCKTVIALYTQIERLTKAYSKLFLEHKQLKQRYAVVEGLHHG